MKWCLLILVVSCAAAQPILVDASEVSQHELHLRATVRDEQWELARQIECQVEVDIRGQVVRAKASAVSQRFADLAEAELLKRTYRPFLRDEKPVEVSFRVWVRVLPLERPVRDRRPFPEVKDWNSVRFKLIRTGCFGSCPSYEVEVQGDGTVNYTGRRDVAVQGTHRGSVSREAVESLMTGFRERGFFSLDSEYVLKNMTDGSTVTISLSIDGLEHTVVDYFGEEAGMPRSVEELELGIDGYSGADKWTRGNVDTVPALRAENFDFKSREAGRVLAHVARRGEAMPMRCGR